MKPRRRPTPPVAEPVTCVLAGGCSYMRAVAKLENLAGFAVPPEVLASGLTHCRDHGCSAAAEREMGRLGGARVLPLTFDSARVSKMPGLPAPTVPVQSAIQFRRASLVDSVNDSDGNYVERRVLKPESLPEGDDPLGMLYQYWKVLRGGTECRLANLDTVQIERTGLIGRLHIVDVSSSDPQEFRFDLLGYAVPLNRLEKPRAHPVRIYAESTMQDYNTVRLTAVPRLHRIRTRLVQVNYHYTRLILPFLDDNGFVSHLAIAIRQEPGDGTRI